MLLQPISWELSSNSKSFLAARHAEYRFSVVIMNHLVEILNLVKPSSSKSRFNIVIYFSRFNIVIYNSSSNV